MGQLVGIPLTETERYVTRRELAAMMGVHPTTVDRMRRAGMPSVVWGRRSRRFKPSVALAWARASGQEVRGVSAEAPVR